MDELTDVRYSTSGPAIAIKTALTGKGMEWFVFHPSNGGHYTSGVREGIDQWPQFYYDSA